MFAEQIHRARLALSQHFVNNDWPISQAYLDEKSRPLKSCLCNPGTLLSGSLVSPQQISAGIGCRRLRMAGRAPTANLAPRLVCSSWQSVAGAGAEKSRAYNAVPLLRANLSF